MNALGRASTRLGGSVDYVSMEACQFRRVHAFRRSTGRQQRVPPATVRGLKTCSLPTTPIRMPCELYSNVTDRTMICTR